MADTGSHKQRTLRGVVWNFLRVFGQTSLGLITGIVLARLLPPSDFGLLALAMVFIGAAELISSIGMEPAVVQRKVLSDLHLRVATTLSLISGTVLTVLFWLSASSISEFFNEPRVAEIIPILAVGLGLSATTATSRGLLIRRMDFRKLFVIDLFAYLIGYAGIAISMALFGFGVWSLVIGSVAAIVLQSIAVVYAAPLHFPLSFSRQEVKDLLGFGGEVSLNNIINYCARNVDSVVIGKYQDATPLGLYTRAFNLASMPMHKIAVSLSGALFPSYAEVQHDRERLARGYLKAINATALLTFPILTGFIISAEPIIIGLYGENWRAAITVFQIIALSGFFKTVAHLAGAVAQATNNVRAEIRRQMVYLVLLAGGCLLVVDYGIEAIGWAVFVAALWMYFSMSHLVMRIGGFGWAVFFRAQLPGLALSFVIALVEIPILWFDKCYLNLPPPLTLLLLVVASAIAGIAALLFLPARIIGEMPAWICQHLAHKLPAAAQTWLARRFPVAADIGE